MSNRGAGDKENEADKLADKDARVRALQCKLDIELTALLSHPLVPEAFKEVFEPKEKLCRKQ